MLEQLDDLFQPFEDLVAGGLRTVDESPGIGELRGHPGLTLSEGIDRKRVDHVGVDQLLLVAFQLSQSALLVDDEAAARFGRAVEIVTRSLAELRDLVLGESDELPFGQDRVLDVHDVEIGQVAVSALGVSAKTKEVVVRTASTLRSPVAHAAVAPSAVDRTLELMGVAPRPVASDPPAGEHILHLVPDDLIDERFVVAVV